MNALRLSSALIALVAFTAPAFAAECGGVAGVPCDEGAICVTRDRHPDAMGVCVDLPEACGGIAGIQCPGDQICVVRDDMPDAMGVCAPRPVVGGPACAVTLCVPEAVCVDIGGHGVCVPRHADDPCAGVRCEAGTACVATADGPTCAPQLTRSAAADPCATARCMAGTHCEAVDGAPICVPDDGDPCAAVRCRAGTVCVAPRGEPICAPTRR